ncbi:MAG: hypothetical protein QMD14_01520 [Candidatus Aenigmarchaeota archaeon]|nr:hypothetical protein [Candidatus Aenigmarchaeota archaeon]
MASDKPKIEGWSRLEQVLEDERNFYKDVILLTGYLWDKAWLDAYSHDDRGYELAGPLYQTISNNFERLRELTSYAVKEIPAMEKELRIMHRLYKDFIEPTYELIYKKVPGAAQDRENKLMLLPDEWVGVTDRISRVRIYVDYRNGIDLIREWYFIKKKPVSGLVRKFEKPLNAFTRKWNEKYYTGKMEEFGFITFCAVDSHDNTVLPKVLKEKEPDKVLLEEIPENGINRVILSPNVEIQKRIEESLRTRTHKDTMCTPNSLKIRLDRERVEKYVKEILKLSGVLGYLQWYIS